MKYKLLKTLIFILILAFYGSLLFYKIDFLAMSVNDLGRHIKNGQMLLETRDVLTTNFYSYTEPDFPFINHHWLSGAVFYFLHETIGFGGMVIFKAAVFLLAFSLIFLASVKKADFWLTTLFSLPAILILKERSELRPEIFSYLFIAIFIYFLIDLEKHPERKRIFWLVPLQLLWVNLHTFFFIGILLTAGFLFEKIILSVKNLKENKLVKKLTLLLLFLAAAIFVNPNGVKGALYPINIFNNYGFRVSENQSLFWSIDNYWWDISIQIFTPMVFLLAFSFLFAFKRKPFGFAHGKPVFYFLASAGAAAAAFFLTRALPLFGLVFLPAISSNFNKIFLGIKDFFSEKWPFLSKGFVLAIAGAFVYTAFIINGPAVATGSIGQRGTGLVRHIDDAAIFFKEQNLKGPIFNNYDIGSYLIYHFFPEEKVFVDNRPEAYSSSFFKDIYYPMIEREEKWQEIQEKYNFNAIFFSQQSQSAGDGTFIMRRIDDSQSWALVYADAYAVILLKNSPENQDVIQKFQITQENISERINYLLESNRLEERVAAANLFIIIGRDDLFANTLQKITDKWPEYSQGWLAMGEMESMNNDLPSLNSAIAFIEKAIGLGEKTSDAHTLLGLTYFRAGQFKKAEKALKNALKIDSNRQDAKNYLTQLQKYLKK